MSEKTKNGRVRDGDGQEPLAGSLNQRLQRLEDLEAIRGLLLRYGRCLDQKDWGPYAELFTEDGEFSAPIGTVTGRAAIQKLFSTTLKDVPSANHFYGNVSIELQGPDRATAQSIWAYICPANDENPTILQFGRYDDVLSKDSGVWLFKRKSIKRYAGTAPYTR